MIWQPCCQIIAKRRAARQRRLSARGRIAPYKCHLVRLRRKDKMSFRHLLAFLFTLLSRRPVPSPIPRCGMSRAARRGLSAGLGACAAAGPQLAHAGNRRRAVAQRCLSSSRCPRTRRRWPQLQRPDPGQGFLPPGQSLRAQLHPAALADYDAAVADGGPAAGRRWSASGPGWPASS